MILWLRQQPLHLQMWMPKLKPLPHLTELTPALQTPLEQAVGLKEEDEMAECTVVRVEQKLE